MLEGNSRIGLKKNIWTAALVGTLAVIGAQRFGCNKTTCAPTPSALAPLPVAPLKCERPLFLQAAALVIDPSFKLAKGPKDLSVSVAAAGETSADALQKCSFLLALHPQPQLTSSAFSLIYPAKEQAGLTAKFTVDGSDKRAQDNLSGGAYASLLCSRDGTIQLIGTAPLLFPWEVVAIPAAPAKVVVAPAPRPAGPKPKGKVAADVMPGGDITF